MDYLVKPDDIITCSSSSLYFEQLLTEKMQAIQAPLVLKVLIEQGHYANTYRIDQIHPCISCA